MTVYRLVGVNDTNISSNKGLRIGNGEMNDLAIPPGGFIDGEIGLSCFRGEALVQAVGH